MSRKLSIWGVVLVVVTMVGVIACGQSSTPPTSQADQKPIRYGDFLYYTRPVHILITRTLPAEEWKKIFNITDLPLVYQQQIKPDGTLTLPIQDNFQSPAMGILWGDYVITASTLLDSLRGEPANTLAQYTVKATILADPSRQQEDPSLSEVIIEGKADLLLGSLSDPRFYVAQGLAVFQRFTPMPVRMFPTPQGAPYALGTMRGMEQFDEVLSVKLIRKAMALKRTSFIAKDPEGVWDYIDGSFSMQDIGSPIFRVVEGKPELVGILVDSGSSYGYEIGIVYDIQALLGILPLKLPSTSFPKP
jgi:hypothetical protein